MSSFFFFLPVDSHFSFRCKSCDAARGRLVAMRVSKSTEQQTIRSGSYAWAITRRQRSGICDVNHTRVRTYLASPSCVPSDPATLANARESTFAETKTATPTSRPSNRYSSTLDTGRGALQRSTPPPFSLVFPICLAPCQP